MGEIGPVPQPDDHPDVRGIAAGTMRRDRADVAVLEVFLRVADLGLRDVIDRQIRDLRLDFPHRLDQRRIRAQVAVGFPLHGHFLDLALESLGSGNPRGDVGRVAAALVVVENLFEMVHPAQVIPGADAAPVALDFHHVQQVLRLVGRGLVAKHPGQSQRVFIIRPAVHALEIGHRRLDPVINFERVIHIRRAHQLAGHADGPLAEREVAPVLTLRLGDDGLEFRLALKDRRERQARAGRRRDRLLGERSLIGECGECQQ